MLDRLTLDIADTDTPDTDAPEDAAGAYLDDRLDNVKRSFILVSCRTLPSVGRLFPNDDREWVDSSSAFILLLVLETVREDRSMRFSRNDDDCGGHGCLSADWQLGRCAP